jgi:hypothetical protein
MTLAGVEYSFENTPDHIKEKVALIAQRYGNDGDAMPDFRRVEVKKLAELWGTAHP